MNFKKALASAFRHFCITLSGCLVGLPTVSGILDIRSIGEPILVSVYVALLAGVIRLLTRLGEETLSPPPAAE